MNAARLIKQAPTLLVVGFVGYTLYSMEAGTPEGAETQAEMQKGLDRMVQDVLADGETAAKKLEGELRDPFWVMPPPAKTSEVAADKAAQPPPADRLAEFVRGMNLEATFIQGKDQIAVIDGRIYNRGQRIPLPGDDSTSDRSLLVLAVTRTSVLLKGDDKHYNLGYPDRLGNKKEEGGPPSADQRLMSEIDPGGQMEMFQRLLGSPLGAMGRGLLGNALPSGRANGARGRGARDPKARGPGSAGP